MIAKFILIAVFITYSALHDLNEFVEAVVTVHDTDPNNPFELNPGPIEQAQDNWLVVNLEIRHLLNVITILLGPMAIPPPPPITIPQRYDSGMAKRVVF